MYFKLFHVACLKDFLVFFLSWLREGCKSHPLFRKINAPHEDANSCSSQPHAEWHFEAGAESQAPALLTSETKMGSTLSPGKCQSILFNI